VKRPYGVILTSPSTGRLPGCLHVPLCWPSSWCELGWLLGFPPLGSMLGVLAYFVLVALAINPRYFTFTLLFYLVFQLLGYSTLILLGRNCMNSYD
jgi:hypothetical protein